MIRHSSLTLRETFSAIEDSLDQEDALKQYLANSALLGRFIRWYVSTDLSWMENSLDYARTEHSWTSISKNMSALEGMGKNKVQDKKLMEEILSTIPDDEMMLLENVISRNLKEYFYGIDWDMVAKYFPGI